MAESSEPHLDAARRHELAASNHDRSARFWDQQGKREQAGMQRQLAEYERHGAELERQWAKLTDPKPAARAAGAAESTTNLTRANAERISAVLNRTAEALEVAAGIAEQHARRREHAGQLDGAAEERRAADRAREYAARARSQAEEWNKLATRTAR